MKTSGVYDSLIRGVSEQVAHDRLPGQHWTQDNMISDPVRGLSRRRGSIFKAEQGAGNVYSNRELKDMASRRSCSVFIEGTDYGFSYRTGKSVTSSLQPLVIVDKDSNTFLNLQASTNAHSALTAGISSIAPVGRFVALASEHDPCRATATKNILDTQGLHTVWVRGGGYSRTFRVTVTNGEGQQQSVEYTTMKSYYDKPLDTSDIPHLKPGTDDQPNPNYNKLVNDRTNAYNSAVNEHIAAAAKDIAPENIAQKLAEKLVALYPGKVVRNGAYIVMGVIADSMVSADDGGNNEFIRACSNEVSAPEDVTPRHYVGKVVRVKPKAAGSQAYYLKAVSDKLKAGQFGEVTWEEAAGETVKVGFMFLIGLIQDGTFYVAENPATLQQMTGVDVPRFEDSVAGDTTVQPIPAIFNKTITHIRMFQDRLMLVAGSTVFMSRSGDYFNFFRDSMLTVKHDDPIEVFAQGSEDDVITSGVQIDRNVILFGRRLQYIVPGKDMVTPNNAYIGVQSAYEGANIADPDSGGSLVFFTQRREGRLTVQQMQPGGVADRLDAFDISQQLDGYIKGTPTQVLALTSPGWVLVRTEEQQNGFYVYSFMDSGATGERLFDSWSRWTFHERLGALGGLWGDEEGILALTVRAGRMGEAVFVIDRFSRESRSNGMPYLDSLRMHYSTPLVGDGVFCAYGSGTPRHLLGGPVTQLERFKAQFPGAAHTLAVGTMFDSHIDLTSPYMRDREDNVIVDAKLTVTKLAVSVSNSAAMRASNSTDSGKTFNSVKDWVYRPVGEWVLNTQGIAEEETITVPVMKDNKAYRTRLAARTWLPLTVSVVEWTGQVFTRTRR